MKIIALDTSGLVASVAILEDENTIAEYTVNYKKTHSQTLLPMLDEIKRMTELDLESVDAIAVSAGPGSFTGLRIGSATAKGLGLALKKPIIPVPTVDAMAYNFAAALTDAYICPIMDARRNQVYTGLYSFSAGRKVGETTELENDFRVHMQACAMDVVTLAEQLNDMGQKVIFLGDGVPVYQDTLRAHLHISFSISPSNNNRQRASSVGLLAMHYYREGKWETAADHSPIYLRMSQAEQERMEKNG
ncbi:MAG: tRNA (adenosine(37)-N6)-threonylcarbamoyltransferase complex dimerization subunit type 1 TsaB [Lachnospiraceae bacterium]